jgi:hypothetical protein
MQRGTRATAAPSRWHFRKLKSEIKIDTRSDAEMPSLMDAAGGIVSAATSGLGSGINGGFSTISV